MKNSFNRPHLFLCLLVFILLATSLGLFTKQIMDSEISWEKLKASRHLEDFIPSDVIHDPINITSNMDFASHGFPGSGIVDDPYVIEDYSITTNGTSISISNTDVYFAIRHTQVYGGESPYNGITLRNVTNGAISNSTISGNDEGVGFYHSSNIIVESNFVSGNDEGFLLYSSSYNTIVDNIISENHYGVILWTSSDNNIIFLNEFTDNDYGNAYDGGTDNHWNITDIGNYWSDYNGTGVYSIPGSSISNDYYPNIYPLETTSTLTRTPTTTSYLNGESDIVILSLVVIGVEMVIAVVVLSRYRRGPKTIIY